MIYSVMNAFKPLEEFFYFPPHFFPRRLTLENFTYLFQLMSSSWVPFSRYIFNTVFITVARSSRKPHYLFALRIRAFEDSFPGT